MLPTDDNSDPTEILSLIANRSLDDRQGGNEKLETRSNNRALVTQQNTVQREYYTAGINLNSGGSFRGAVLRLIKSIRCHCITEEEGRGEVGSRGINDRIIFLFH